MYICVFAIVCAWMVGVEYIACLCFSFGPGGMCVDVRGHGCVDVSVGVWVCGCVDVWMCGW